MVAADTKSVDLRLTVQIPADMDPKDAADALTRSMRAAAEFMGSPVALEGTVKVDDTHARVAWTVGDVCDKAAEIGLSVTDGQAEEFLYNNARQIQDDMVERGWASIATLLEMENFPELDDEMIEDEDEENPTHELGEAGA